LVLSFKVWLLVCGARSVKRGKRKEMKRTKKVLHGQGGRVVGRAKRERDVKERN